MNPRDSRIGIGRLVRGIRYYVPNISGSATMPFSSFAVPGLILVLDAQTSWNLILQVVWD